MKKKKQIIIILSLLINSLIVFAPIDNVKGDPNPSGGVIDGDTVYWENSYARLEVYPHTSNEIIRQKQYADLTWKEADNTIDVAFRFDNSLSYGKIWRWNGTAWVGVSLTHQEYQGYHYYKYTGFNVVQDGFYQFKWEYDTIANSSGKWWLFAKLNQHTIQQALDNNWYVALDPWWDSDWGRRELITIEADYIDATLTNFPVLISNTSTNFTIYAQADGDDFAFVSADNVTQYNHEIERYNSTTGELIAWVNVTSVSSSVDTVFWLYFGNPTCGDQQDIEGTWNSNYVMVLHMNGTTYENLKDSTSYSNDATSGTGCAFQQPGVIGYSVYFNRTSDAFIEIPTAASLDGSNITVECWAFPLVRELKQPLVTKYDFSPGDGFKVIFDEGANTFQCNLYHDNVKQVVSSNSYNNVDGWYHAATGVGSADRFMSVNSTKEGDEAAFEVGSASSALWLGRRIHYDDTSLEGYLDEVRISNIRRNDSWITASFHSQNQTIGFISFDTDQVSWTNSYPVNSDPDPENVALTITPILRIQVNDADMYNQSVNTTWRSNSSGDWIVFGVNSSSINTTFYQDFINGTTLGATYYWSVNTSDGNGGWDNDTYSFTVNILPAFSDEIPLNNSVGDNVSFDLSIAIVDANGHTFNWTIETYPNVGSDSGNDESNGTKTCTITPLFNRSYIWFVNCTDSYGWTRSFYNFTISENTDETPPVLDIVNVTATDGFNVSTIGYINLSVHDTVSTNVIVNITVNGETFNETVSNPGQTATYSFNLSITGENLVIIVLTDDFGNSYTYQQTHTIYFVNVTIVNERTGAAFNWTNAKDVGSMISANVTVPGKAYRLDIYANENTTFYYIGVDSDVLRFEVSYTNVTTVVIRSFSIDLLGYLANIGLVEVETEFYEQLIYSTGSKPVTVRNIYSDCFIEAGYTSHAYGSTFTLSALTIDMLYYLYTYEDGHTVFLASIEGSRTAQINLDFLDHVNVTYEFSILSDGVGIARFDTDSIIIYYLNVDDDNSRLDIEIYDGTKLVFSHTEFADPNEVTVYFNYGAINLTEDILELRFTAYDADGNEVVTSKFFSISTLSESPLIPAGIAAIISLLLAIFGFTFVSTRHVFGFFGIFALVAGLGLTAFAEQLWYIRLIQVVLVILLAFTILIFKEESSAVT